MYSCLCMNVLYKKAKGDEQISHNPPLARLHYCCNFYLVHNLKIVMAHLVGQQLVGKTKIHSDGDVFHNLFRHTPHHVSNISPNLVQACDLHGGKWGTVGSVVVWSYVHGNNQATSRVCVCVCLHVGVYVCVFTHVRVCVRACVFIDIIHGKNTNKDFYKNKYFRL